MRLFRFVPLALTAVLILAPALLTGCCPFKSKSKAGCVDCGGSCAEKCADGSGEACKKGAAACTDCAGKSAEAPAGVAVCPVTGAKVSDGAGHGPAPAARAAGTRAEVEAAIARVKPALVRIAVVSSAYYDGRALKTMASGSGAIISEDGYVVTNHHVAGDAVRLVCTLSTREEVPAELIGTDPMTDIAVIKLKPADNRKFSFAAWGDSARLAVGDEVLAMGSPHALSQSVTQGIVSNTEMVMPRWEGEFQLEGENVGSIVRWIAHDAAIFPGNSGGPLVNLQGEVIGINEISFGLGGAIPGNLARVVAADIIAASLVQRAFVGFVLQPVFKHDPNRKGAIVSDVIKGSPAALAGIKAGDRLLALGGQELEVQFAEQMPPVNQLLGDLEVGKPIAVKIERDGKPLDVELKPVAREPVLREQQELKKWGITVRDLSFWTALELKRPNSDGVLITSLSEGGGAGQAKPALAAGDVILKVAGEAVKNREALTEITRKLTEGQEEPVPALVEFARDEEQMLTVVHVGVTELHDPAPETRKAWIPVATQVLTNDLREGLGLPEETTGVRVTAVYGDEKSTAALGLKVGDVIVAMDGEPIPASEPGDSAVFSTMVRRAKYNTPVTLTILREGKPLDLTGTRAGSLPQPTEMKRYRDVDFEFSVRDVAYLDREQMQLDPGQEGVIVILVQDGGWTSLAGLMTNDILMAIDDTHIRNEKDVEKKLAEIKKTKPVSVIFKVRRGIHTQFIEIEPIWSEATE